MTILETIGNVSKDQTVTLNSHGHCSRPKMSALENCFCSRRGQMGRVILTYDRNKSEVEFSTQAPAHLCTTPDSQRSPDDIVRFSGVRPQIVSSLFVIHFKGSSV